MKLLLARVLALGLLGLPLLVPAVVSAQTPPGPGGPARQPIEAGTPQEMANAQLVIKYFNMVFTAHQTARAFALYTSADFVEHHTFIGATHPATKQEAIDTLNGEFKRDPSHVLSAVHVVAQGDLVSVHSAAAGGDIDIFRVKDGKIVEHWDG